MRSGPAMARTGAGASGGTGLWALAVSVLLLSVWSVWMALNDHLHAGIAGQSPLLPSACPQQSAFHT